MGACAAGFGTRAEAWGNSRVSGEVGIAGPGSDHAARTRELCERAHGSNVNEKTLLATDYLKIRQRRPAA